MELSFIVLKDAMNHHLAKMIANATHLFVADVSKEEADIKKRIEQLQN